MSAAEFYERRPRFRALKYIGQSLEEVAAELEITVRSTRGPLMFEDQIEVHCYLEAKWKYVAVGQRCWIVVSAAGVEVLDEREFTKRFEPVEEQRYILGFDGSSADHDVLLAEVDLQIPAHHDLRR